MSRGGRRGALGRLRRALTRARRRLGPARADLVYSEAYRNDFPPPSHDRERAARILAFLDGEGLVGRRRLHRPDAASLRTLRRVHDDAYLESLQHPGAALPILGVELSAAEFGRFLELQRTMVGGTLAATALARRRAGVGVNLGGGLHHATAGRGQGFCAFNDVAAAIGEQRAAGFAEPVLVIDLDLHDGDGTRAIFATDPTVHTLSIHNRDLGPAKAVASTSVALGGDVEDAAYLQALREHLPRAIDAVAPALVFYLAGCDPAADDALGDWRIGPAAMLERDRFVFERVRALDGPPALVILLAGGYGRDAWRYSARFLSWILTGGRAIEPPVTEELTLAHYRDLSRGLSVSDLTREPAGEWTLTEEDVLGPLRGPAAPSRFLGYYTRHGIELALERYGFLDRLRRMGFRRLDVAVELDDPAEQTLRVFERDRPAEPLVELRVRRDGTTVRGLELLRVEWLALQNPRADFSRARPRLPGQRHPGLGVLRDVVAMLVVVCERLGLDGIVFWPAHYHLAVQSQRMLRFLDPRDEARFRSLMQALRGLPLDEATRAVDTGRVREAAGGAPFVWKPAPMVIAVSSRLRERVESPAYERAVGRLRTGSALTLEGPHHGSRASGAGNDG